MAENTVRIDGMVPILGHMQVINGVDPRWNIYVHAAADIPGVATANNYISGFNPAGSGKIVVGLQANVSSYAYTSPTSGGSMLGQRISAASGGSLVATSNIGRNVTSDPDPVLQVRTGNPTVTTVRLPITLTPPSAGSKEGSTSIAPAANSNFVFMPGEGFVFYANTSSTSLFWGLQVVWAEYTP